jgi:Rieske Fe-S protein
MGDERERDEAAGPVEPLSVDEVARLDAYLDDLAADRAPAARPLPEQELAERVVAAQLRMAREGVDEPSPAFLRRLERKVARAVEGAERPPRLPRLSRGGFLRGAATLAGGVGLGVAAGDALFSASSPARPDELVAAGNARWYDVAAVGEVPPGGAKAFTAGGVEGYLLNRGGALRAVSGICTHLGCRLKPDGDGLRCLCHDSRFDAAGRVMAGLAPRPLPEIDLRVAQGRVYARGTREEA